MGFVKIRFPESGLGVREPIFENRAMSEKTIPNEDALPQLLGEFRPVDVWQSHMSKVFYGLKGHRLREYYQTFAAADYRLGYALAADYVDRVRAREKRAETPSTSALTVMEWGCGNGNLAACFLDRVMELDEDRTLYSRIQQGCQDFGPRSLSEIRLIYCGWGGFGQIFRSFSLT